MRTFKLYTLSTAATLLLASVAHADDSVLFGQGGYASQSVQRSADAPRGATQAEPHWTSRIGTGTASSTEKPSGVKAQEGVVHYPAPYWASLIGTGTAARL